MRRQACVISPHLLSLGEPRLRKQLGRELPISKCKAYLKALGQENISEEMLTNMPRTFEKLRELSASADKEAFCNKEMQGWVRTIKETNGQPFTNVKGLYQKALNEPIGIKDIKVATSGKWCRPRGDLHPAYGQDQHLHAPR